MASLLAVPANEGMRSARLGGTGSLGHQRAPGACRPVGNGWVGHIAIAGHRPRSGASRRRASLSRPCASQQGWPRSVVWVSSQRKLAEYRAAVPQLRQASLAGGSACAVEALPSSQTAEQPASRAAAVQDEQPPRAVSATGFGGKSRTKKRDFRKTIAGSLSSSLGYTTMQKAHPLRTQGVVWSDSSILSVRR